MEDIASEVTVGFVGSMTSEYVDSGVPFLRSKNIDHLTINAEDLKYISREFNEKVRKSKLAPGDVVIVRTGKPGTCAVIPEWLEEANCSDLVIVRCGPEVNCHFLAYYINTSASSHVSAHLVGAVQQHFNVGAAKKMKVLLPSIIEQEGIVGILGALDDKIDLNRQMNTTLETMAQALFKSWFVDFDPVIDNALAAGNPIPELLHARAEARKALGDQRERLPVGIQQKFPDQFVFTEEMGWVPEGWEVSAVGEQVEIMGGGTPSTKNPVFWDDGVHAFCTPKDMSRLDSIVVTRTERYLTDAGVQKITSGQLPAGVVLMSSRAPIGYLAISNIPVSVNQGIIAMLPNDSYGAMYLLSWAHFNMGQITDRANGSTFMEISKKNFRPIPFLVPNSGVLNTFNQQAKAVYSKVLSVSENIEKVTKLRDTLLPKLLSGELRIPEGEQ
ncbi:restriction endonuclease subunit S [Marinobacter gelidimuriae]|uniref:restriction endonuclease subunit S n=1 Tax=Marinobacter gelidimuriae TaxID=2739064 RepID=UPI001E59BF50|nr:restriction endonuclease subunit S [Marinobacter gelidimuriae]